MIDATSRCILEKYEYAALTIENMGIKINRVSGSCFTFRLMNGHVTVYPYKGYFAGQPIGSGRGIGELVRRIESLNELIIE